MPYWYRMPYPHPGKSSVAIESRKHAASLPSPPLPSAALRSAETAVSSEAPCARSASPYSPPTPRLSATLSRLRPMRNSADR